MPEPLTSVRVVRDPSFGDPFESRENRPGDVRELVTVGAIRLGVTIESKVRNERAVIAVLKELGSELDVLERGRRDSFEQRVMEYQPLLRRYRDKLAPHMDGAFAVKAKDGWTDTERIEPPTVKDGTPAHE